MKIRIYSFKSAKKHLHRDRYLTFESLECRHLLSSFDYVDVENPQQIEQLADQIESHIAAHTPPEPIPPRPTSEPVKPLTVPTVPSSGTLMFEAESAVVITPIELRNDSAASGGAYAVVPSSERSNYSGPPSESLIYRFAVEEEGDYRIFSRTHAHDGYHDSLWFQVDTDLMLNDVPQSGDAWAWNLVSDRGSNRTVYRLNAGEHELRVAWREPDAEFDGIIVTSDPDFDPNAHAPLEPIPPRKPTPEPITRPTIPTVPSSGTQLFIEKMEDRRLLATGYFADRTTTVLYDNYPADEDKTIAVTAVNAALSSNTESDGQSESSSVVNRTSKGSLTTNGSIQIDSIPDYGDTIGIVNGHVTGVTPSEHRVTAYIQIEGAGWWTKPFFTSPTVGISPDGSFSIDTVTGGIDDQATIICIALISDTTTPPIAGGAGRIPSELDAIDIECRHRYANTIEFSGFEWGVKESSVRVGPGGNYFSNDAQDVFVDDQGRLHLTVSFRDGEWKSSEVILTETLGYGTYAFKTESRVDTLDPFVTFGAFTWDSFGDDISGASAFREIDFEDGVWADLTDPLNAQIVVQPYHTSGNLVRYAIPDLSDNPELTRFFTWKQDNIEFVALRGHHSPFNYPDQSVIFQHNYVHDPSISHFVPTEGRENFRFNVWLNSGETAPNTGESVEVIVSGFSFAPSAPPNAMDDTVSTIEGQSVTIDPLTNDVAEAALDPNSITITDTAGHGSTSIDAVTGVITYTPSDGFYGIDSFAYTVNDTAGSTSNVAHVTVRVAASDLVHYHITVKDTDGIELSEVTVGEEFLLEVGVEDLRLAPDNLGVFAGYLDIEYDSELLSLNGELIVGSNFPHALTVDTSVDGQLNEAGAIREVDPHDPIGGGIFTLLQASFIANSVGTLSVTANPADEHPLHTTLLYGSIDPVISADQRFSSTSIEIVNRVVAIDDHVSTDEDTATTPIAVLDNDSSNTSAGLEISSFEASSVNGALITLNGNELLYDPSSTSALQSLQHGETIEDSFTYTISDGDGGTDTATVTVTVSGVNDAPSSVNDSAATNGSITVQINVLVNDFDVDDGIDASSLTVQSQPESGTVTVGVVNPWQNPVKQLDVNDDGSVSPIDALQIINSLNANGVRVLPRQDSGTSDWPPPFLDTNGDGHVTAVDVLIIINALNNQDSVSGEFCNSVAYVGSFEFCSPARTLSRHSPPTSVQDIVLERIHDEELGRWRLAPGDSDHHDNLAASTRDWSALIAGAAEFEDELSLFLNEVLEDLLTEPLQFWISISVDETVFAIGSSVHEVR